MPNIQTLRVSTPESRPILCEIGRVSVICNQLIGYFTLNHKALQTRDGIRHSSLKQNILRFLPRLYTIFVLCIQLSVIMVWITFRNDTLRIWRLQRNTEVAAIQFSGGLAMGFTLLQRIAGLFFAGYCIDFWKTIDIKLNEISKSSPSFYIGIEKGKKYSKYFRQLRNSIKKSAASKAAIIFVFDVVFHAIYSHGILKTIRKKPEFQPLLESYMNNEFLFLAFMISWNLMIVSHVFVSLFLTMPLAIISLCLQMVAEEISDLHAYRRPAILGGKSDDLQFEIIDAGMGFAFVDKSTWAQKGKILQLFVDEEKLQICIDNYYRIVDIVQLFQARFEYRLAIEIIFNALMILANGFLMVIWTVSGQYGTAASRVVPITLSLTILYHMGTDSGQLGKSQGKVFKQLSRLPHHLLSYDMEIKVKYIVSEISKSRLGIKPGNYFTLNRKLITSLLSAILTFLIVLVQFRSGESVDHV